MVNERRELHKTNYPPQSLGYQIFPPVLEGRIRPIQVFEQPASLLIRPTARQKRELSGLGINTLSDLMGLPFTEFRQQVNQWGLLTYNLSKYFREDLAIGPEGHLLRAIFVDTPQIPIPLELEGAREIAVAAALATLRENEREILGLHFGLTSSIRLTIEQTAGEIGIGRVQARNIETLAFRKLRHPSNSAVLSLFAPLPPNSLGKTFLGSDFGVEINKQIHPRSLENLRVRDLNFAQWGDISYLPLSLLIRWDKERFSEPVSQEIKQLLAS